MARIESMFDISGTYKNLVVYKVGGKLYGRTKSRLDRKRFLQDPAFARSRAKAKMFGKASALAKEMYASLPKEKKRHGLFGKLTGRAHKGLQSGMTKAEVVQELYKSMETVDNTISQKVVVIPTCPKKKPKTEVKQYRFRTTILSEWYVSSYGLLEKGISIKQQILWNESYIIVDIPGP